MFTSLKTKNKISKHERLIKLKQIPGPPDIHLPTIKFLSLSSSLLDFLFKPSKELS